MNPVKLAAVVLALVLDAMKLTLSRRLAIA